MRSKTLFFLFSVMILNGCSGTMTKLGVNNGRLMACPDSPNCVSSQADNPKQQIQPITVQTSVKATKARLLVILSELKNAQVTHTENDYLRAEFTSKLFRFVDDVEFHFPATDATETTVHVRSASRVGRSDFGVNRKRIERIRSLLKQS